MLVDGGAVMWNRQLKLATLFFGLILLSIALHSHFSNEKLSSVMAPAVERQPASGAEKKLIVPLNETLQSDVYQFDRRMKAVINQNETLTDVHYAGYFFIDWKEVKNGERQGVFSFQVTGSSIPPVFIQAAVSDDYSLLSLQEPKTASETEQNALVFLKDLISIYTFKNFEDTTGKYSANLKLVSEDHSGRVWVKNKIQYEDTKLVEFKFIRSIHRLQVSEKLDEASGLEDAQMGNELKIQSVYLLKRVQGSKIKKISLNLAVPLFAGTIKTNPNQVGTEKLDWTTIQKKLELLGGLSGKARMGVFHELVNGVKYHPEQLQNFMEWMHSDLNDHQKVSMGVGVLASVGSSAAQHELLRLYEQTKNNSVETAHLILNSFATSGNKLTPEVTKMLNSVLENPRENPDLTANAAYALGASGDVKKITELASQAATVSEKIVYIDAMGNSGSLDTLPYLLESVQSSDPQVREKAIFALRFVNDQRVNSVFEQSMSDPSMGVRYSVVKALSFQANPHDYESLLKNCSIQAPDKNLKTLCSQTLAGL